MCRNLPNREPEAAPRSRRRPRCIIQQHSQARRGWPARHDHRERQETVLQLLDDVIAFPHSFPLCSVFLVFHRLFLFISVKWEGGCSVVVDCVTPLSKVIVRVVKACIAKFSLALFACTVYINHWSLLWCMQISLSFVVTLLGWIWILVFPCCLNANLNAMSPNWTVMLRKQNKRMSRWVATQTRTVLPPSPAWAYPEQAQIVGPGSDQAALVGSRVRV